MSFESEGLRVDWKYYDKQKVCLEKASKKDNDITVFLGGYRSGKSITGSRWLIREAMFNENGQFLCMAVDYNKGKQTTYNVFFDQLPGSKTNPFKGGSPLNCPLVAHWTKIDRTLTFLNGSTIVLAGADEESRYEGGSFNAVWMDEPGNYRSKLDGVTSTILERIDAGPPQSILWTTTGKTGALQRILQDREWKDGSSVDINLEVVRVSTEENPFLDKSALKRLKRRYSGSVNEGMALHGEFGDVEGRVYPDFSRERHVKPREELMGEMDENTKWFYGYDAGWSDERVVLKFCEGVDGSLFIVDEFYESESFVSEVIEWLDEQPRGRLVSEHVPEHIERFKRSTVHSVVRANKSLDPGIDAVRERVHKDGLFVAKECDNTVREFLGYEKCDVGGSNVSDHAMDCVRYVVMEVDGGSDFFVDFI